MKFLNRMLTGVMLAALVLAAVPALLDGARPASVARAQSGGPIYLPLIDNAYIPEPPPFSIQIAGMSQIQASSVFAELSQAEAAQVQEELIAELDAAFPSILDAIKESGAGYVRLYVDWGSIQPLPGGDDSFNWTFYDKRMPKINDAGLGIIATISGVPAWAKEGKEPCNIMSADGVQAYYAFLEAFARKYHYVDVWEILNEPDAIPPYRCGDGLENYGKNGEQYAEVLQGAYTRLKRINPAYTVIMGGIAHEDFDEPNYTNKNFYRYFLDDVIKAGGASFMDGVNFHYFKNFAAGWEGWTKEGKPSCLGIIDVNDRGDKFYAPYGFDITAKASHIAERLGTCFGVSKPLWATETGANGVGPNNPDHQYTQDPSDQNPKKHLYGATLDDQAQYVFKMHARGFASGVKNITWYAIQTIPSLLPEDHQGLLFDERDGASNGQPKPAYFAYQTMTRELGDYRYDTWLTFDPRSNPPAEAYQFRHFGGDNAGNPKVVAWINPPREPGVPIEQKSLTLPVPQVRVVTRPGSGLPEEIVTDGGSGDLDGAGNGTITLELSVEPKIIELLVR